VKFLDPNDVLKQFGIYGAQDVADLGAGAGHFSFAAARRLEGGRLYAVDLEREMLARLVSEANTLGHANIHPLWGDASKRGGVPLADQTLDRAIATNILYQVDDRSGFAEEVKRLLRPGGKVLVIEWRHDVPGGPHSSHKVSPEMVLSLFGRHGFTKESDVDAGEYHYGMILVRSV
jgi:ubiquinone/menaquinone biosynthesis C-methylase UbiE